MKWNQIILKRARVLSKRHSIRHNHSERTRKQRQKCSIKLTGGAPKQVDLCIKIHVYGPILCRKTVCPIRRLHGRERGLRHLANR